MTDEIIRELKSAQNRVRAVQQTIKTVVGAMSTLGLRTEFLENAEDNLRIVHEGLQRTVEKYQKIKTAN